MNKLLRPLCFALLFLATCAGHELCAVAQTPLGADDHALPPFKVGEAISLFDGQSLAGWTRQDGEPIIDGWIVKDEAICRANRGGNICYEREVGDFELTFDWKIVAGGNSGLKYRVRKYGGKELGCEYQLLGEKQPSFTKGSTGSLYDLYEPNGKKLLNPAGEWNSAKIIVQGPNIEHWLNGKKIVEADLTSEEWQQRLAKSKLAPHNDFARNTLGRIMLTDHGSKAWFRNLILTPLESKEIPPLAVAGPAYVINPPSDEQAEEYKLDAAFYKKCTLVQDILIATSDRVADDAIREAAYQFDMVMSNIKPEVAQRIRDKKVLCILISHDGFTSDLPQFATDKTGKELDFYNWRQRGFLAHQDGRPTVVFAEEDVLEYEGGMQLESILIHEFGHVIHGAGFDEALQKRLTDTFERAQANGIWMDGRAAQRFRRVKSETPTSLLDALIASFPDQPRELLVKCLDGGDILINGKSADADVKVTKDDEVLIVFGGPKECYAHKNRAEYWAEGVQCWYDTNRTMDHDHNHIHTREQLKAYDPVLAELCQDVLGDSPWRFDSPRNRAGQGHLKDFDPAKSPRVVDPEHIEAAANDYYDVYWKEYWQRLREKHGISHLTANADGLYFPPPRGEWETVEPFHVGWDKAKLQKALDYAGAQKSTGVVILHRGRILAEQYWELTGSNSAKFNERLVGRNNAGHGIEDVASAQKSVASVLVGIAQQKGLLRIDDPISQYLGVGWSRATREQEQAITIRHVITMTSGLNMRGGYDAKPGTKWLYNTTVYAKSMDVLEAASGMDRHELTKKWLTEPSGMSDSKWTSRGEEGERAGNAFGFATTARDLARFGLLMLADGKWDEQVILADQQYLKASTTTSQQLNPHYGYLWWVSRNANAPAITPRPETAPADMFAAQGALSRRCYVVPSLELVVTRLGDQPEDGRTFDRRLWKLLMDAAPE